MSPRSQEAVQQQYVCMYVCSNLMLVSRNLNNNLKTDLAKTWRNLIWEKAVWQKIFLKHDLIGI